MLGIHRTKSSSTKEKLQILAIAFAYLGQSLIEILSLGFLTNDWPAALMFEVFDKKEKNAQS